MKKHHKFGIKLSVSGCMIIYLLASLVAASFNIKDWGLIEREVVAIIMFISIVVCFAIADADTF